MAYTARTRPWQSSISRSQEVVQRTKAHFLIVVILPLLSPPEPMFARILKRKRGDIDTPIKQPAHDWATAALVLIAKAEQGEKEHQSRISQLMTIVKEMSENSPLAHAANTIDDLLARHKDDTSGTDKVTNSMRDVLDRLDTA